MTAVAVNHASLDTDQTYILKTDYMTCKNVILKYGTEYKKY